MSSQTLYEFQPAILPAALPSARSCLAVGSVVSICDSPAFRKPVTKIAEPPSVESNPDGLGAARGVRTAFFFEVFLVMTSYGIWHLWHLAR